MSTILALAIVFIVGAVANLMTAVVDFFLDGIWDIFEMSNTAFLNLFGSTASDYYSQYFLPFSLALACILCGVALVRCLLPEEVRGRADSLGGLLYRLPMVLFFVILSTFFMSQISSGFQYLFDEIKNTVNIDLSATEALAALEDKGLTSSQTYPADYSFINDILNQLLATIFTAWLYFNVLRIMQSVAVKYVLQHLLLLLSPLAFSTLATSNTQSICFSYLKLYIGTLVALLIDDQSVSLQYYYCEDRKITLTKMSVRTLLCYLQKALFFFPCSI